MIDLQVKFNEIIRDFPPQYLIQNKEIFYYENKRQHTMTIMPSLNCTNVLNAFYYCAELSFALNMVGEYNCREAEQI